MSSPSRRRSGVISKLRAWRRRRSWHPAIRLRLYIGDGEPVVDLDSDNLNILARFNGGSWDLMDGAISNGARIRVVIEPVDLPNW